MADVPDYDSMDEAFPALPPPHSPGQEGPEGADLFENGEDGDVSKLADVPAAKRKGVKRPQPKLDSQRLISERGLPALRTLFDNVRFKGKGHEAEDLKLLMQKMENWAHRLFPKLQFEDFIDKVEKLGTKKEVQTCLKRIRLDMPLTPQDFMGGEEEEPAAADPESRVFGDPDPFSSASFNDLRAPVHSTPAPPAPASPPATSPSLTEEQRERMELNRRRALERRTARQQQPDPSDSQTVDWSTSAGEPPSVSSGSVLNISKDQDRDQDEEVEASDPEPASTQHTDSEPPAAASGPPSPAAGPPSPPAAAGPPPPAAGPPPPAAAGPPPPAAAGPPPPAAAGPPPPAAAGPPSPAAGPPSPAAGPPSPPAASGPPPPAVGPPLPPVGPPPSEEEEGSGRVQVQEDGD